MSCRCKSNLHSMLPTVRHTCRAWAKTAVFWILGTIRLALLLREFHPFIVTAAKHRIFGHRCGSRMFDIRRLKWHAVLSEICEKEQSAHVCEGTRDEHAVHLLPPLLGARPERRIRLTAHDIAGKTCITTPLNRTTSKHTQRHNNRAQVIGA